jgi:hypothetical protein
MFEIREIEGKDQLTCSFEGSGPFQGSYNVEMFTCPNVFCHCVEAELGLSNETTQKPFYFELDFLKRNIRRDISDRYYKGLYQQLRKRITASDWELLFGWFQGLKHKCMKTYDVNGSEVGSFGKEDIEDGLMQGYHDIFPWGEKIQFEVEGILYNLHDQYCLRSHGDCGEAAVHFLGFKDSKKITPSGKEPVILLNCKTKKWKNDRFVSDWPHHQDILMARLLEAYPNIFKILRERQQLLMAAYNRYLKEQEATASDHKTKPKISRNQPCPCGSGKKYKKCCGK